MMPAYPMMFVPAIVCRFALVVLAAALAGSGFAATNVFFVAINRPN